MPRISSGWLAVSLSAALFAQQPEARPAFEAANIKLNTTGSGSSTHGTPGQLLVTNLTIKQLVERAFSAKPFQVTGPDWMQDIHFDLAAKYPSGSTPAERPVMLRTLLEDRFKLMVHHESRELPGYVLLPAKGGFKLKPVEAGPSGMDSNGGEIVTLKAEKVSLAQVAEFLARQLNSVIVDRTAIPGVFDFELQWTGAGRSQGVDASAIRFDALSDAIAKIGLRLQAQKIPIDVVVVDHVERAPTEN